MKSRSPRERCKTFPFLTCEIASTARCVGVRDTNVNQSRFAEVMTDYAYYKAKKLFWKKCLTNGTECAIIQVQSEGDLPSPLSKKVKKKLKKPLDKPH